jgi:hypothetical protein
MAAATNPFARSIERQISLNRARTPTERLNALCDLLDAVRAMAPRGEDARVHRCRAQAARERNREQLRAHFRQLIAAGRTDVAACL